MAEHRAAAGLALPSEAASRGPRQALLGFVGLFMLAAIPEFRAYEPSTQAAVIGAVFTSLYLVLIGFFAIGEADGWPRRFARDGWLKPGALLVGLLGGSGLCGRGGRRAGARRNGGRRRRESEWGGGREEAPAATGA